MKKSALSKVIAVLVVMVFVLAACAKPAPPAAAPTAPAAPVAPAVKETAAPAKEALPALKEATPLATKPYGTVTVALNTLQEERFDPAISTGNNAQNTIRAVVDMVLDRRGTKLGPGLAERWELAPDAMSWTLYLRQDVKFSNGDPLTARDVKFSMDYITPVHIYPLMRNATESVDIIDPYTVRIRTKFPAPFIDTNWGSVHGLVLPSDYIKRVGMDTWERNPIGSGPWLFQRQVFGDYIEYKAKEEHWRQVPAFAHLKLVCIPEEVTRVAALQTGQVDMVDLGFEAGIALKGEGLRSVTTTTTIVSCLLFGVYRPEAQQLPVADKRVRQALSLAINRQEIADKMFVGRGGFPFPPFVGRANGDVDDIGFDYLEKMSQEAYRYDPVAAKKLLAEAGYPQGFSFNLYSYALSYGPFMPKVAEVIAAYWKAIGVNATVLPIEWATMARWRNANADILAGQASVYALSPTERVSMQNFLQMGAGMWANAIMGAPAPKPAFARYQELAAQSEMEADKSKRAVIIREALELLTPEYVWNHIVEAPIFMALGPRIDVDIPKGTSAGSIGSVFEYIKHREE